MPHDACAPAYVATAAVDSVSSADPAPTAPAKRHCGRKTVVEQLAAAAAEAATVVAAIRARDLVGKLV